MESNSSLSLDRSCGQDGGQGATAVQAPAPTVGIYTGLTTNDASIEDDKTGVFGLPLSILLLPGSTETTMEALAAFGLACNVMQTIHFTVETVSAVKNVFKNGSVDPSLRTVAARSESVYQSLSSSLLAVQPLNGDDHMLVVIAGDCLDAAKKLKAEVDGLTFPAAKGKFAIAVLRVLQMQLKGSNGRLEKLNNKMMAHQRVLEAGLLARVCKQNDALRLQQEAGFDDLNQSLQKFIQRFSEGQTRLEALIDQTNQVIRAETVRSQNLVISALNSESAKTRSDVADLLAEMRSGPPIWQKRERLLRSLKYDTMNDRLNLIGENQAGTYQWILEGIRPWVDEVGGLRNGRKQISHAHPDCSVDTGLTDVSWKSWKCFPCWLMAEREKLYWIQGKPGSGKSTLMRFLVKDHHLWSSDCKSDPIILSHFIWTAGTGIQRSLRGVLLTLLYQLMEPDEQLQDDVLGKFPRVSYKDMQGEWSLEELTTITLASLSSAPRPIFIFIDGLDEIGTSDINTVDTPTNLLNLIDKLARIDKVKLCVSSRPEPEIRQRLKQRPTLQLQDLTRFDMKKYAENLFLQPYYDTPDEAACRELIETLCGKANGVFLWTALAIKSLQRGLAQGETIADLQVRLQKMPDSLFSLYKDMWSRLNEDLSVYREEAARYFNIVRDWSKMNPYDPDITIIHVMLALDPVKTSAILENHNAFPAQDVENACQEVARRLVLRTAGLLEVHPTRNTVHFVHRSALEFLENDDDGKKILRYDDTSPEERQERLWEGFLAQLSLRVTKHFGHGITVETPAQVMEPIHDLWEQAKLPEELAVRLMMHCKKIWDAGAWKGQARPNFRRLDFAGLTAGLGFHEFISLLRRGSVPGYRDVASSVAYRLYLLVAAFSDEHTSLLSMHNYQGKSKVVAEILDREMVMSLDACGMDSHPSVPAASDPFGTLAARSKGSLLILLAIISAKTKWPETLPPLPSMIKYLIANRIPTDAKVVVVFKLEDPNEPCKWILDVEGVCAHNDEGIRKIKRWAAFEMNIAALVDLYLSALASGPESSSSRVTAQIVLEELRAAKLDQHVKTLAFSVQWSMDVKLLQPDSQKDEDKIRCCLTQIRVDPESEAQKSVPAYQIPGLFELLKAVQKRAKTISEDNYMAALDLPTANLATGFMGQPPAMLAG